jgi:hypothetical protein
MAATLAAGLLAGCSGHPSTSTPSVISSAPPSSVQAPTPGIELGGESGLPRIGQPVEASEGLTLTVLRVADWPAPTFLADAPPNGPCATKPGDHFVAVEISLTATADGATLPPAVPFAFLTSAPPGSRLVNVGGDRASRTAVNGPLCRGADGYDARQIPMPEFEPSPTSMTLGEVRAGWILLPVQPQVYDAGHIILVFHPGGAGHSPVGVRLRP